MLTSWNVTRFHPCPPAELMALSARTKAILYARVSTADQAQHGYSLESQLERCAQRGREKFGYRDEQMLAIVEPGVSGDDPNRPALNQVLYLLAEGVGRKVIILHPDRLSRDLHLQHSVWRKVLALGVDLEFVEVEFDPQNPESMLMFNIQGSIAQYNKAKILANSRRGRKQKAKNGKIPGLRRVYGYHYDPHSDTLVENPEEKRVFLLAVDWLLNGRDGRAMTCNAVAEQLARLGIPGPDGSTWYGANLARILHNEVYTGTFHYGKTEVARINGQRKQVPRPRAEWLSIPVPAFIDRETFDRVQAVLRANYRGARGRKTEQYLLKRLARCGRCGGAVVAGPKSAGAGQVIRYYMCCNKGKKGFTVGTGEPGGRCRGRNWRQDAVDASVWAFLLERLADPEPVIAQVVRQQGDMAAIAALRSKLQDIGRASGEQAAVRGRYVDLYALGVIKSEQELQQKIGPIDRRVAELRAQAARIAGQLRRATESGPELDQVTAAVARFKQVVDLDAVTSEGKRALVEQFIRRVTLHEDNTIEILVAWSGDPAAVPGAPVLLPSSR